MTRNESVDCIRRVLREQSGRYSDTDLSCYAERLGDDPILLALFGRLLRECPDSNPLELSQDVIGHLIDRSIGELTLQRGLTRNEYLSAVDCASEEMLRRKVLYPQWKLIQGWFQAQPRIIEALNHLAVQGHICRLADRSGMERFEFRHDRILEYFLSLAASRFLEHGEAVRECINDPFLVGILGRSIARPDTSHSSLEWVRANMPVALVAALPYLPMGCSAHSERIVSLARDWLTSANQPGLQSMLYDARSFLVGTHSGHVLEATVGSDSDFFVALARLRNGDALAGINALSRHRWFPPSGTRRSARVSDLGRDALSSIAAHPRPRGGPSFRYPAGRPARRRPSARRLLRRPQLGRRRKERMGESTRQKPDASCRAMGWASLRRQRSGIGFGPAIRCPPAHFR